MAGESFIVRLFHDSVCIRLFEVEAADIGLLFVIVATLESVLDLVVNDSIGLFGEVGIDNLNGVGPGEVSRSRLSVSAVRNRLPRLEDVIDVGVDVEAEAEGVGIGRLDDPRIIGEGDDVGKLVEEGGDKVATRRPIGEQKSQYL
jgi:hypothetical protein